MNIALSEALDRLRDAVVSRDPDSICIRARELRLCVVYAKEGWHGVWTEGMADSVKAMLQEALQCLIDTEAEMTEAVDGQWEKRELAQFCFCRVAAQFRNLFPEDAYKYEQRARDIWPSIRDKFVAGS